MSTSFDISIMYQLLKDYGDNVPSPTNGWGKVPVIGQRTAGYDIERIRVFRNMIAHYPYTKSDMNEEDFRLYWEELAQVIIL